MKKLTITLLCAASVIAAQAKVLTPAEALKRANPALRAASKNDILNEAPFLTIDASDRMPAVYMFAHPGTNDGFTILSADDIAVPVLGMADGYFTDEQLPDNMRAWLDFYAEEIAAARAAGLPALDEGAMRLARPERSPITPICKTTWNQDAPYNNLCPKEGGRACYTGCVATAMAQVLKTYEYPARCTGGIFSYKYNYNGAERTINYNFDNTVLNWEEMLNSYAGSSTASQRNAIANLMYAVGVASCMSYGTAASGANAAYTAQGLIRNFDYNKNLTYEMREWYDLLTWEDMIYNTLSKGYPAYYDGQTSDDSSQSGQSVAGHAFVVDGYRGEGFYHLNWGWGGMSDGYFLLSALDPSSQGIGGSTGGYNFRQGTIINMAPKKGNPAAPIVFVMSHDGSFGVNPTTTTANSTARVTFTGGFYNLSPYSFSSARFATCYTAEDGTKTYADGLGSIPSLDLYVGTSEFVCSVPTGLPNGRYVVTPVIKSNNGRYYDIRTEVGGYGELIAEINGTTIKFSKPQYASIKVVEADVPAKIYANTSFSVNYKVKNPTDQPFYGGVRGNFGRAITPTSVNKLVETAASSVSVEPLSEEEFAITISAPASLSLGNYKFYLTDYKGKVISEYYDITLQANPGTANFETGTISVASTAMDNLNFTVNAKLTSGYYSGPIIVAIRENGKTVTQFTSKLTNIGAGETKAVTVEGEFMDGKVGAIYGAQAFATINGQPRPITDNKNFKLTEGTDGIESIDATEAEAPAEYYDLQGRRVASPREGAIYLMRRGAITTKVKF